MMTIEAAIIIPITLTATILVFWSGLLLYNRCTVEEAAGAAVLQGGAKAEQSNDQIQDIVLQKLREELDGRLALMDPPSVHVTVSYDSIRAQVDGEMRLPALPFYGSAVWSVSADRQTRRLRESQIVRTLHRIDRALEERQQSPPQ